MSATLLRVDPARPEPECLARAAAILHAGGLVAFPTETVYGLGAHALDARAVERIFQAKGRPSRNPIIVHDAAIPAARALVADWPEHAQRLAERFWPGPLTLVLPRAAAVPDNVTAGGATVGIRVPAHPVALGLLQVSRIPIAAPSANLSTQLSPTTAQHVAAGLGDRVDLILDGGPCPGGLESTVIDLTRRPPRLLRPGLISPDEIRAVVGPIDLSPPAQGITAPLPAPGLLDKHYAPRTPLYLTKRIEDVVSSMVGPSAVLVLEQRVAPGSSVRVVEMPRDAVAYAARLYAVLHELDGAGLECIVVEEPPATEAWRAVRDRLKRAASPLISPL